MSKRKFFDSLDKFAEQLTLMSGWARRTEREPWMGTPQDDCARVRQALEKVKDYWPLTDSVANRFQELALDCVTAYERGDIDAGDAAYRDVGAYEQHVRDLAYKPRSQPASHTFTLGAAASNEPEA